MFSVYDLIDPRDDLPFYVGVTNCLQKRLIAHLACVSGNMQKNRRIQALKDLGLEPEIREIDTASSRKEAIQKEKEWIKVYRDKGLQLTNITPELGRPLLDTRATLFFVRLDKEWKLTLDRDNTIDPTRLEEAFKHYTFDLETRFPSKRDIIPLWIEQKRQDIQEQINAPTFDNQDTL